MLACSHVLCVCVCVCVYVCVEASFGEVTSACWHVRVSSVYVCVDASFGELKEVSLQGHAHMFSVYLCVPLCVVFLCVMMTSIGQTCEQDDKDWSNMCLHAYIHLKLWYLDTMYSLKIPIRASMHTLCDSWFDHLC